MSADRSSFLVVRKCLCGCGKELPFGRLHFLNDEHYQRAWDSVKPASLDDIREMIRESPAFEEVA